MPVVDLPFHMQDQLQSQWCWSAVSVSTDLFYSAASAWTQCLLVNDQLGQSKCCGGAASSSDCDQPWYLDNALSRVNRLAGVSSGRPANAVLFQELDNGRPVGLRIQWTGTGNGHFVMVTGYDDSNPANILLDIDDPYYGHSTVAASSFPGNYQTVGGSWTHTYRTKQ